MSPSTLPDFHEKRLDCSGRCLVFLPTLLLCWSLGPAAMAQVFEFDTAAKELQRQQERERALREQQQRSIDVRLPPTATVDVGRLQESETPCFTLSEIVLESADADFAWTLPAADRADDFSFDPASGRCLGSTGINRVMARIQNAIVARGYLTTRVLAKSQDLRHGILTLTVVPGRIRAIRFADESNESDDRATMWNAMPARPGDLLNLRDIEQALENFKRLPSADAQIQIVAGDQPGESDLVITWKQTHPLRLTLDINDGGARATGKYLGSVTVSADHLLMLNDLFYTSVNHDLGGGESGDRGTEGYTLHYSLPFGYSLLGATASANRYRQSVAGATQTYLYRGTSANDEIRISRVIRRDATSRTLASLRGYLNQSRNFIDDTEIEVQRRRMAGWEAALGHRAFMVQATLDLKLAYRQGTGAFAALPAPEEAFGEGSARPRIVSAETWLTLPFSFGKQRLRYSGDWRAQWNATPLIAQDRFSIGGRYTVRGFDGESVLMAERGWLVRNDLGLTLGPGGQELYLGIDYGQLGGQSAELLVGKRLSGAVLGLRGSYRELSFDFFAGQPLYKPEGFKTSRVASGFNLTLGF
jgi:hemolysin activation/secretion protein